MSETQTQLPFSLADLTVLENHKISVYPDNQHWLAAMRDKPAAHPEATLPVAKLMESMVDLGDGKYGFELPKKSCLFTGERQLMKKQSAARDKAVTAFYRLIQKIARQLKISVVKAQKLVSNLYENMQVLDPWLEEITRATSELQATSSDVATTTVIVQQRLNSNWTEFDTLVLPEPLFEEFLFYSQREEQAWKATEEESSEHEDDSYTLESADEGDTEAIEVEGKSTPVLTSSDMSDD